MVVMVVALLAVCLVGGVLCDYVVRRTGWKRLGRAIFPLTGYLIASIAIFSVQ